MLDDKETPCPVCDAFRREYELMTDLDWGRASIHYKGRNLADRWIQVSENRQD
jgi:hypothetical protein